MIRLVASFSLHRVPGRQSQCAEQRRTAVLKTYGKLVIISDSGSRAGVRRGINSRKAVFEKDREDGGAEKACLSCTMNTRLSAFFFDCISASM